jgi:hypothetical protein
MHFTVVQKSLGFLLMLFSLAMLPPMLVGYYSNDGSALAFLQSGGALLALGVACWLPACRARAGLRLRQGFLVVALLWTVLGLAGALPLLSSPTLDLSFTDAAFESISGLTTPGASGVLGLASLAISILFLGRVDCHEHRLDHRLVRGLARLPARPADLRPFYRWLRQLDRRRPQGHPRVAAVQTGPARAHPLGSSECARCREAGLARRR